MKYRGIDAKFSLALTYMSRWCTSVSMSAACRVLIQGLVIEHKALSNKGFFYQSPGLGI